MFIPHAVGHAASSVCSLENRRRLPSMWTIVGSAFPIRTDHPTGYQWSSLAALSARSHRTLARLGTRLALAPLQDVTTAACQLVENTGAKTNGGECPARLEVARKSGRRECCRSSWCILLFTWAPCKAPLFLLANAPQCHRRAPGALSWRPTARGGSWKAILLRGPAPFDAELTAGPADHRHSTRYD
jgi:hypothetical protein